MVENELCMMQTINLATHTYFIILWKIRFCRLFIPKLQNALSPSVSTGFLGRKDLNITWMTKNIHSHSRIMVEDANTTSTVSLL